MCELSVKYVLGIIFALVLANNLPQNQCQKWGGLTYCSTLTYSSQNDQFKRSKCEDIDKATDGDIRCTFEIDRLRCLERLLADTADFGVFKAEDLFLVPSLNHANAGNLVITNEMRQSMNQSFEFDMVVLVSNNIRVDSLSDLRGQRLCHPGFDEKGWLYDWSEVFSQYFEETVVQEQCDPSLSVAENKIKSLNDFFGSACKAGSWSPDPVFDEKLKSKYNRLCANCLIQATCSRNDAYWGQLGPFNCLTDCSGDVAWVRLQDIEFYLRPSDYSPHHNCADFSFLCPDGSKQPLNTSNPCVWLSRPWPVILARRTVREHVSSLIQHLSTSNDITQEDSWEYKLRTLLSHSLQPIYSTNPNHVTPYEYLEKVPGFLHANKMKTCKGTGEDKTITICTENESVKKKCDLMTLVARVYSIDPEFNCTLVSNCLKHVAEGKSDVVVVSTSQLKRVYEHHDLQTILYQTSTGSEQLRYMFAVVRQDSKIHQLKQLRGKKACFSEVGGLGWNSLLMVLRENSLIDDYCDEKSAISNFFSDVCIVNSKPGDSFRSCFDDDFEDMDIGSLDLNEAQGLRCIADSNNGGDVSFIDFYSIEKYLREFKQKGWFSDYLTKHNFKYICPYKNSTSRDCYLSKSSFGQVLVRKDLSDTRIEEISSAFLILSSLLSSDKNLDPIFKMFTHYRDEKNVLFENKASRLESAEDFSKRIEWTNNVYELKLQDMVNVCREEKKKNGASSLISVSVINILLPITFFIIPVLGRFNT